MHWTVTLFLISLVINAILGHLLHNSQYSRRWNNPSKAFTMPLILWILFIATTFVPVLNTISTLVYIIIMIVNYSDGTLELNEDFWLAKKY